MKTCIDAWELAFLFLILLPGVVFFGLLLWWLFKELRT